MRVRARHVLVGFAVVIGLVAIVLVVASFVLGSYVHRHQGEVVAQLEQRLGRKVDVGQVSASLFSGLTVERLTIAGSPARGDEAPLATAERIRVRPAIFRSLVTLGRRVQVASIEVTRPTVNVVRLGDGSLNIDHVAEHWRAHAPAAQPAQPMSERTRRLVENARIRQARIRQGSLRFTDEQSSGRVVEVSAIDLLLADVGIKRHPSLDLHAAVMAAQPNLALRAQLGPAGSVEELPPPLESARLTLARTDLGPLVPLLSRVIGGLEAGVASADLELRWDGVDALKGRAQLTAARFARGAPFDATLDVDAVGDTHKGDVDVRRLDLEVAGMALVAHGKLQSLKTQPRFEDFSVESRNLDFDGVRRIDPQLDRQLGATLHGPVQLRAGASAQRFTALADLTAASLALPGRFEKPRGATWRLDVSGSAQKNVLAIESLTLRVAQQTVRAHGTVRLGEPHPLLDLYAATDGLPIAAITPFVPSLAQAGLPPLVISTDAHVTGRAGVPETLAVDVQRLAVASRKSDVSGTARVRNFARPQIEVSLRSSHLDSADLLPSPSPSQPARARPASKKSGEPSPVTRISGHVALAVAHGIAAGKPFDGLQADLALRDGNVHANRLDVGAWGGRVAAAGSDYDVAGSAFHAVGKVDNVDVEQLLSSLGGARKIMSGRLAAQLDVKGKGASAPEIERSLAGTLDGTVTQAQLLAFNLDELLVGQLLRALPYHLPTQRLADLTSLGTVRARLRFADGAMILDRPLTATTPEGPLELTGRLFFDGRMDLTGTMQLAPSAASALFANRVRLSQPIPLALRFTGTLHQPSLAIPNLADVGSVLVRGLVGGLIPGRQDAKVPSRELQQQAVDRLKGLLGH